MPSQLKKYLKAIAETGAVSETALYTPIATHILSGLLHYPAKYYAINKTGSQGTPDIRLFSGEDSSEWIVCEAKLRDKDVRSAERRQRIWKEQILERGYIRAETFYVLLCAPRTFYVCDLEGRILEGVHLEDDGLLAAISGARLPITDSNFRGLLDHITFEASLQRPQYEHFRRGDLKGGFIQLSPETVSVLQETFNFALRELRAYCAHVFDALKQEYLGASSELTMCEQRLEAAGSDSKARNQISGLIRRIRRRHRLVLQLFEADYPQFKHDQTYAGTEQERHFEDIFITNTAYVALSRLFFIRICEDIGLTTRKISHEGPSVWRRFVDHIKDQYQDLIEVAYKDVFQVYSQLFEVTVFDWYGHGNGRLNDVLERILFRLNAFSFTQVNRDVLGSIYQYFRPKAERKRLGEYYTPEEVVDYILAHTGIASDPAIMSKHILDPSCGSFTFGVRALVPLLRAAEHLSAENKIQLVRRCLVGYDINPFSVFLSHLGLLFAVLDLYLEAKGHQEAYALPAFSIENRNSLTYFSQIDELHGMAEEFERGPEAQVDYVIGNPPFVRNERLPQDDRVALSQLFSEVSSGNTDIATYFLYYAMRYWLRDGGVLGMVAPIGIANTEMADKLRQVFRTYSVLQVTSLEWMAKEIFPDADIIPMLIFAKKESPKGHRITVVSGLKNKGELKRAISDRDLFRSHSSELDYETWLSLSPTGDWPIEAKAIDVRVLEKLRSRPPLGSIVRPAYAVKLGPNAKVTRPFNRKERRPTEIPFLKGHHICAFNLPTEEELAEDEEMIDIDKMESVSGASLWRDLTFYRNNQSEPDESGVGRHDYKDGGLINNAPSDTLCCFVPEVYVTLVAAVGDPLRVCANNSVSVVVPLRFSAPVIAAIINSRVSRYYAFLLLRSAVLLRRRAHWYPRTIKSLPLPDLTSAQAVQLHELARDAANLAQGVHLNELDAYRSLISRCGHLTKAGFLGIKWSGNSATLDLDEVADSAVKDGELQIGDSILTGESESLHLLRLALLSLEQEELPIQEVQDLLLPASKEDRADIATQTISVAEKLESTKQQMKALTGRMDEVVAQAVGLTPSEYDIICKRCEEFPLSVTVERPRYLWSPDRKRQARRMYQPGTRFK